MIDTSYFSDVADNLGINDPAIVEKDYWVTQLLLKISTIKSEDYEFVFSGGTCLSKAHANTSRMSEDIDIKLVASPAILKASSNMQKNARKNLFNQLTFVINDSKDFSIITDEMKIYSEYKHQYILVRYPKAYEGSDVLRDHIQLEITESELLEPYNLLPLKSLYSEALSLDAEVSSMKCVSVYNTASEKLVALLRRTALVCRDNTEKDDEALIRHAYDLYMISSMLNDFDKLQMMIRKVIDIDIEQFSNKHGQFKDHPINELQFGLEQLKTNEKYKSRYENFINPLVYSELPPNWNNVLESLSTLVSKVLKK
ncbi:nucleotidyl transferase AbiEii/AbiGii toxin family protein [Thiotrichales bacterium 19S3-7]|nr:nucleotidyl transferase AbiEii/AbiGii toxin family protein [Thiotrichales bacterium 19S3-7]MCF6803064.1 nucleotidyl transferase AbiEii/AbiGii toxin family protein [Thiotrichales bacterium 19S3-11]